MQSAKLEYSKAITYKSMASFHGSGLYIKKEIIIKASAESLHVYYQMAQKYI